MALDPKFKKKWTAALRSGDYLQARRTLKFQTLVGPSYCCLGVAKVLLGKESTTPWMAGLLDAHDRKLIGISDEGMRSLANRNDGDDGKKKYSFADIADHIDRYF